jgi:prepilin-type N-terminal cleavage/methylation domain-containing protein
MRSASGFSLLEVLIALIVISVGLLGFAGTLGPAATLAGRGKQQTRMALIAESRIHRFRVALGSAGSGCALPANGAEQHGSGVRETWSAVRTDSIVELRIVLEAPSRFGAADTVATRMPCP